ncbi:MAG: FAD-dependent oxidoreductase [Synergistales bacterium]|nr:FAD-dependent oxidoreductase [Synergistales bacterium]
MEVKVDGIKSSYDAVIVGKSAGGLTAATAAKRIYPEKEILVIDNQQISMIPCGIPYIFGTLATIDDNRLPSEKMLDGAGVDLLIDEVTEIGADCKSVFTRGGNSITYDKLLLATGSRPTRPKVKGCHLENVFTVPKTYDYLKEMRSKLDDVQDVTIVGAGFIALEVADEIRKMGKNVTVLYRSRVLRKSFDPEFGDMVKEKLENAGIKMVHDKLVELKGTEKVSGVVLEELKGTEKVSGVVLEEGGEIKSDMVVFSIGYQPNDSLAVDAGLEVTKNGIRTDEYMRTSQPDILAIGDCAEPRDFFTGKASGQMLASTATFEGRVAGANMFQIKLVKESKRNIGIYSTDMAGIALGVAGLTETAATAEGFEIVTGVFSGADRHPGKFEDTSTIHLKLIFSRDRGAILGAELAGGKSVGEMTNILGLAIQKRLTASEIYTVQFGTHPHLTASPAAYQIVKAAEDALAKLKN